MSHTDVTREGQLDRLEGNLVRGRVGESSRLFRLHIDGQWYFCKASDFDDIKRAGALLRHIAVPARVVLAPYIVNGRRRIGWLRVLGSDETLPPADPFKTAGLSLVMALIAAAFCVGMHVGWSWVNTWSKAAFVVSIPVILLLAGVTVFCVFFAVFMGLEAASRLRPSRVRAFFAYRRRYGRAKA